MPKPFEKLKKATLKAQTEGPGFKVKVSEVDDEDYVNRFLFSAFDYKGQAQSCYTAEGYAGTVTASYDPAKPFCMTLEVEGSVRGARAKQLMVLAHMTQDTWLTYKQTEYTGLKATLAAKATATLGTVKANQLGQVGGASAGAVLGEGKKDKKLVDLKLHYSSMTYGATVIFREAPLSRPVKGQISGKAERNVAIQKGSGVCYGISCEIESLVKIIMAYDPLTDAWSDADGKTAQSYLETIAKALRLGEKDLLGFFADAATQRELITLFRGLLSQELKTVLLESSFALSGTAQITHAWSTANGDEDVHALSIGLSKKIHKTVEALPDQQRSELLQSLRIRYRLQDISEDDEAKFKLGFKLLGVGAKLQIDSVERAGSDGMVDLKTIWKTGNLQNASPATVYNQEHIVPPVILFCQ